jgi:putative membrane protein
MMPLFANVPTWDEFVRFLVYAGAFGVLGIALLAVGFKVFELITPKLDIETKLKEGNVAVGIMVGALLIAIAIVIYAAIA